MAGLMLGGSSSAGAQEHASLFSRWEASSLPGTPTDTLGSPASDYRYQGLALPDSIRVVTGYQHWRGAALGLAIGAGVGTLFGALAPASCDDCTDPWSRGRAMWTVGLLGAGTGGVVGFLAGLSSPKYVWVPTEGRAQSSP